MRPSRRAPDELRAVSLERGVVKYAEGSCMVKFGDTHVLVTATLEERLPPWLKGQGRGWVTAEYGMLPRATLERTRREASAGKQNGRTVEIQRLIGRSLRATVDLEALGERQITVDCDVIQADGGTRTASITGAWVALADCIGWMKTRNMIKTNVLRDNVAAISCGIYQGTPVLDLDYAEDSEADTDANFVMAGDGRIIEVQGTAEKTPFSQDEFLALMALARKGVARLVDLQKMAVALTTPVGKAAFGFCRPCAIWHRLGHAPSNHRQARDRDPQSRQARRDAGTVGAAWRRSRVGRRTRPWRTRRDRH